MPNVANAKHINLMATFNDTFAEDMINLIKARRTYNTVRIHDSGDFYNQEYYNKWCEIAAALPNHIFYAYTKALTLDLYANKPNNLMIIQSMGGLHDNLINQELPHSRIFSTDNDRIAAGYTDGNTNDVPAIQGVTRIGLVYHGVKKLTIAQQQYFK